MRSNNPALRDRELPKLLAGEWAGAIGMSNAMKFVCGLEPLEVIARQADRAQGQQWLIDGTLPWVTNLRAGGFSVAAAAQPATPGPVPVFSFRSDLQGVRRSQDLVPRRREGGARPQPQQRRGGDGTLCAAKGAETV